MLAGFGGGMVALGSALIPVLVTWLIVRQRPAETYSVVSKPTFGLLLFIGLAGFGRRYGELRAAGASPGDANVGSFTSFAGLLIVIGIIGLFRARSLNSEEL